MVTDSRMPPPPRQTPAARERRFLVRAGLFVAMGLGLAALVVMLIGKERRFFDEQMRYRAAFDDVDGLKLDSPVRLGGLEVGRVTGISFAPDLGDKRIAVEMEVSAKFKDRVRGDSVARVSSRGVLGDKAVDISLGSPEAPAIEMGAELQTGVSGDLTSLLKASGEIVDNAVVISRDLRLAVTAYTNDELRTDVGALMKSLRKIAGQIETGDGTAHALIYDRKTADGVKALLASATGAASRLDAAVGHVEGLLRQVKEGQGLAHALLYDAKGAGALSELAAAATEVSALVSDARKSRNGAIHQLVYGDSRGMFADLGSAAEDLKAITGKVKSGQGSLGGLIYDPSVYEDLKDILGNVKRNRLLRELVRFSISNGENLEKAGKPPPREKP